MLRLLMASEDGYLYVYSLDVTEGGDCALIRQFHLSSKDDPMPAPSEAVRMEQQQLEAGDQVDGGRAISESKPNKKLLSSNPLMPYPADIIAFLVDISYADRLKNRHPTEMTGN